MKNKPRIRFKGFAEDWEQRKLSDITDVIMGQSPSSKNYTDNPNDNILVQGNADLKDGKVIPRLWTKEITKTIDKDGIILTVRAPVGDVAKTDYKVVLGRGVAGIKGNDFIYQFLQKLQYNRHWVSLSSGSTFESINSNDIKDLIIDIPSIEEQNKISMLLNNVNSIITLHQRKLEKLKLVKKALLQKLFPKNGSQFPEIRFKGFTDTWEQRKLTYIFNDFIVPMRDKPKVFSGTTPWTRIEDIEGRYINTSLSGRFVSDETIKSMNLKVIPKGSLIVSASATFGVVAIVNNDLITNQTFIGLVPNKDFDIDFLYSLFEAPTTKNKLLKLSAGSTIFYIARESFENLVLSVPSKVEQIKISKIFKSIDNSITLHQQEPFLCGNSVNGGVKLC